MVPRRVGGELRRRRERLVLTQADVGRAMGRTRQYVSAIEHGVRWDPDADMLVVWARTLGWADAYILERLGRVIVPGSEPGTLTPELQVAINEAVAAGVREGVADALRALERGGQDIATPPEARRGSLA